jgi:CelD/BcsL family acetyltransferase involved in cellulose biosynthesis
VTPWWQRVWWRHFGEGAELLTLSVRDGDEVIGIAPLMIADGAITFLGGTDLFDYHDFLVIRGKEAVFYNVLWDYLVKLGWHTLELRSVPEGSPTLDLLSAIAEEKSVSVDVAQEDVAPLAFLPASWDEYLAGLSKKGRHELRRKLRRLERADSVRQYVCENAEMLPRSLETFFRLLRASSADKKAFLTPERESFFLDIAVELAPRGQFKLYFLELDGVPVASCICFDYAGSYLLYNSGYDPEYSALSVGMLNKALCMKDAIDKGRGTFEFLRGAERYKYDLGATDRALYQMTIHRAD